MKRTRVLSISCAMLALAACTAFPSRAPAAGMLTGSLAGAAPASVAARAMDDSDRRHAASALEASPDGQASVWRNRETGDSFVFTPTRSFDQRGARCRDFRLEVTVGARLDSIGGSACRQADGAWRIPS